MSNLDDELDRLLREQESESSLQQQQQQLQQQQRNFMPQPVSFLDTFPIQPQPQQRVQPQRSSAQQPQQIDPNLMLAFARQQQQQQSRLQQQQGNQQPAQRFRQFLSSLLPDQQTQVTDTFRQYQSGQITRQAFSRRMIETLGNEIFEQMLLAIRTSSSASPSQLPQQSIQQQPQQLPFYQASTSISPSFMSSTSSSNSNLKRKSDIPAHLMGPPVIPAQKSARVSTQQPTQQSQSPSTIVPSQTPPQQQQQTLPKSQNVPPGFLPQSQSQSISSNNNNNNNGSVQTSSSDSAKTNTTSNAAAKDVDVTKMDTSSLQDVINYAGVDLKAESELILREAESRNSKHSNDYQTNYQDETRMQSFIQPVAALSALVRKITKSCGLSLVDSDCDSFVALATQHFLKGIIEKCVQASKARVEFGRDSWSIDLLDGELAVRGSKVNGEGRRSRIGAVKRPLIWLEKFEKTREARLAVETFKGSVSEEGRLAMLDAGIAHDEPGDDDGENKEADDDSSSVQDEPPQPKLSAPTKKKSKQQQQQPSASESYWKDKDDLVVRTRLSNMAALQAVGLDAGSKYSWMTMGAGSLGTASSITAELGTTSKSTTEALAPLNAGSGTSTMGGFGLPRPQQRKKLVQNRKIVVNDIMFVLRNDNARWLRHAYRCRVGQ